MNRIYAAKQEGAVRRFLGKVYATSRCSFQQLRSLSAPLVTRKRPALGVQSGRAGQGVYAGARSTAFICTVSAGVLSEASFDAEVKPYLR